MASHPPVELVVFDCDGTLVDSQATIVACAQAGFKALGLEPPEAEAVRRIVGLSLEPAMCHLLGRNDPLMGKKIADAYRDAFIEYRARPEFKEPLFDGVMDLLGALRGVEMLMGVATGKNMRGLENVIAHHKLDGYFVTLQTADLHPSKPHPSMLEAAMRETGASPETTIIVGDTSFDIDMGRNAGCRAIGVSYGNHPTDELLACGAETVLDDIGDLKKFL